MSKKWTSWIEHTGDINQKWDNEEDIKIKLVSGVVVRGIIESLVGLGPFTHYKRLKANVEAEKAKEATPQPIITGPGLYKTSGLYQAEIHHLLPNGNWSGVFGAMPDQNTVWNSDGTTVHPDALIIGPWVEPKPEPEEDAATFSVGDQCSKKSGYQYPGKVVSIFETTAGKTRLVVECTCPEVAGMLHIYSPENLTLSHTVGEE